MKLPRRSLVSLALTAPAALFALAGPAPAQCWEEAAEIVPATVLAQDDFGSAVALWNETLAAGAANAGTAPLEDAGKVFVFERDLGGLGAWGLARELMAGDTSKKAALGAAVALEGDTLVATATGADVGLIFFEIGGLAFDSGLGALFGSEVSEPERTVSIDLATGAGTPVGALGFPNVTGLAYDAAADVLYGVDRDSDQLLIVDPATGTGSAVGPLGFNAVQSLAFDPGTNLLYGVDVQLDQLLSIDPATGNATAIGATGFPYVSGLAFDPATGTLYGVDSNVDDLLTLDTATGQATSIASLTYGSLRGLAWDPGSGTLYGTDQFSGLVAIDPETGVETAIGPHTTGFAQAGAAYVFERDLGGPDNWGEAAKLVASNAYDQAFLGNDVALSGDTLVVANETSSGPDRAYVFERNLGGPGNWGQAAILQPAPATTGFADSVAVSGDTIAVGEPFSGRCWIYARDAGGPGNWGEVLELPSPAPGTNGNFGRCVALDGDRLFVSAPGTSSGYPSTVYVFERDLGGPGAWGLVQGLQPSTPAAYFGRSLAADGEWLAVGSGSALSQGAQYLFRHAGPGGSWFQAEVLPQPGMLGNGYGLPITLSGTTVATGDPEGTPGGVNTGKAHVFERTPVATYCTAGTTASGCSALLSATGAPSSSAPSGFFLQASGLEGQKNGLFFFAANGRQANPWGNGTSYQCVAPPVNRGALLAGTGSVGACDGSFSYDLNARWTEKPGQNPGPGAVVQAQLWLRDPLNTSNQTTSLSDALELTVCQ